MKNINFFQIYWKTNGFEAFWPLGALRISWTGSKLLKNQWKINVFIAFIIKPKENQWKNNENGMINGMFNGMTNGMVKGMANGVINDM